MGLLRLGVSLASVSSTTERQTPLFAQVVELALAAEAGGFDSLFMPDHLQQNRVGGGATQPMPEAYVLLGAVAAQTRTIRLGALVTPVTFRHPSVLAKMITTLDVISDGRAILGIGAGWDADEHQSFGLPFPNLGQRMEMLEEAVVVCKALLVEETPTVNGKWFSLNNSFNVPRPIQSTIPILIGGGGENRTLKLTAKYANIANFIGNDLEVVRRKLKVLQEHCDTIGRDYGEITKTVFILPSNNPSDLAAEVAQLQDVGVEGVVIGDTMSDAEELLKTGQLLRNAFS
jgi:F420-dependent oxidoreductase-like protein